MPNNEIRPNTSINLLNPAVGFHDALHLVTTLDLTIITSVSSTSITMVDVIGFDVRTFTITGTGLTLASIGGFPYLRDGLVDQITIADGGTTRCSLTSLGLAGSVLGTAMRQDREGTNGAALENLFRGMTYTLSGNNSHLPGGSAEGPTIALQNGKR